MVERSKNREVLEIFLTSEERIAARQFLRNLSAIPQSSKEIAIYAEVAGMKFREYLPRIAKLIRTAHRSERPFMIEGFQLGYVEQVEQEGGRKIKEPEATERFRKITGEGYSLAKHSILAMAIMNTLGYSVDPRNEENSYSLNHRRGKKDEKHNHENAVIVIGLRGVEGVKTHLYDPDEPPLKPMYSVTLNRSRILYIPKYIEHEVDGYVPQPVVFLDKQTGREHIVAEANRNTAAYFMQGRRAEIDPDRLDMAIEKYTLNKGVKR